MSVFMSPLQNKSRIAAIGSALVDLCLNESEEFVTDVGAQTGGMVLVDNAHIENVLAKSGNSPSVVPGGSACNTIVGIAQLGGKARFVGKRGADEFGRTFEDSITRAGVDPILLMSPTATGRVLSIITPDAQRSMLTYLGASAEIRPYDIKPSYFEDCAVVHIEGYLLFNPDSKMTITTVKAAKAAGALVSLDLASYTVVAAARELLDEIIADRYVDILIANEDEAAVFTGYAGQENEERALSAMAAVADLAVLKLGKRGSAVAHKSGQIVHTERCGDGTAVDTTGAGDLWAAGFLYGLVNGYSLERAGRLASMCGHEVCRVVGAHIPDEGWERIKKNICI